MSNQLVMVLCDDWADILIYHSRQLGVINNMNNSSKSFQLHGRGTVHRRTAFWDTESSLELFVQLVIILFLQMNSNICWKKISIKNNAQTESETGVNVSFSSNQNFKLQIYLSYGIYFLGNTDLKMKDTFIKV